MFAFLFQLFAANTAIQLGIRCIWQCVVIINIAHICRPFRTQYEKEQVLSSLEVLEQTKLVEFKTFANFFKQLDHFYNAIQTFAKCSLLEWCSTKLIKLQI